MSILILSAVESILDAVRLQFSCIICWVSCAHFLYVTGLFQIDD